MSFKKLRVKRKQLGMKGFLNPRYVDFRILGPGMVAVHQESPKHEEQ
jgi:hypothetical protein